MAAPKQLAFMSVKGSWVKMTSTGTGKARKYEVVWHKTGGASFHKRHTGVSSEKAWEAFNRYVKEAGGAK